MTDETQMEAGIPPEPELELEEEELEEVDALVVALTATATCEVALEGCVAERRDGVESARIAYAEALLGRVRHELLTLVQDRELLEGR